MDKIMSEFEVEMKFKGEPRLTVYKKARTEDGARFAAILEASMNGFDVNVVEFINIKEIK
jgi:hypothetical protein